MYDVSLSRSRPAFVSLHERFLSGETKPRDYMESVLEALSEREPALRAFVYLDPDLCRKAADESAARYRAGRPLGVLDGCPVGIKDIIETRDMPTGCGSPAFAGQQTERDAACVLALREGGAIPVGKTVTTEFAIGFSGPTVNAHDPRRTPGGSSSGSAAAVGAGLIPLALGTQTQGSVLRPASYNGCIGFKGTHGLLPLGGVHPLSDSHDHLGLFANSFDDLWAAITLIASFGSPNHPGLGDAASAAPAALRPRRLIRLYLKGWSEVDDAHKAVVEAQFDALAGRGVEILSAKTDARIAALEELLDRDAASSLDMVAYDMRFPYLGYIERFGDVIGERIHGLLARSRELTPGDYDALLMKRMAARQLVTQVMTATGADAYIMPAASGPAPEGFVFTGSRTYLGYWSWLGFPAVSVPVMQADAMPWGLQIAGAAHMDTKICALARWVFEGAA